MKCLHGTPIRFGVLSVVLIVCWVGPFRCEVEACGVTTHGEIAERTPGIIDSLSYGELVEMLLSLDGERDTGSMFPDWGWGLLMENIALLTHSETFSDTFAAYVQQEFPPPYTQAERRQVTFLMGILSHRLSDDTWHPGFLAAAMVEDGRSHDLIEAGVDVFCNWEQGEGGESHLWWVPVGTAEVVYERLGHPEVTRNEMISGMSIVRAGYWAARQVGPLMYWYAKSLLLPWSNEYYVDYVPGGVADCAVVSAGEMMAVWDFLQGPLYAAPRPRYNDSSPVWLSADLTGSGNGEDIFLRKGRELVAGGALHVPVVVWGIEGAADAVVLEQPQVLDAVLAAEILRSIVVEMGATD